jgi:hypothetical protein
VKCGGCVGEIVPLPSKALITEAQMSARSALRKIDRGSPSECVATLCKWHAYKVCLRTVHSVTATQHTGKGILYGRLASVWDNTL